ncbi:MAG: glycosyltransferase [Bacteroidota bacterium]
MRELPAEYEDQMTIDWIGEGVQIEAIRAFEATHLQAWDIRFHGFQPKPFIAEKMQEASFLVHPSDAENLPTVIIESLCCGNPVLSHAINGIPELIHARNGLLARPKDQADFTARLTAMLQQYSSFDRPAIAREAQERFSPNAIGAAIFAQYPQP